jgi:hypothetical protein
MGVGMGSSNRNNTTVVEPPKVKEEEYDLQAELEKKFDELFGNPNKK